MRKKNPHSQRRTETYDRIFCVEKRNEFVVAFVSRMLSVSRREGILFRVEEELVELKTQLNEVMNELMTLFRQSSAKDRLRILRADTRSLSLSHLHRSPHVNVVERILNDVFLRCGNAIPIQG